VVNFTHQPLYLQGKSHYYLLVGPRAELDAVMKRKVAGPC
jgi:hypothetical protein